MKQQNFNPAEFALDLVSVDFSSPESEEESRARVQKLLAAHRSVGCVVVCCVLYVDRGTDWIM